jgi:hypothetical protein
MSNDILANIVSNRMAYLDENAKPLAEGRLSIYESGSSTGMAVITDKDGNQIPNPVMLDSAGRAPELYAQGSVMVKVEKYIGMDASGERLYSMVYDFKTPPGVDISSYWNVNYVETYAQLNAVDNKNPTWVTGEGNPHLYVFDPTRPSTGLNGCTNVNSSHDQSGSWKWETKEVYADQCSIHRDGTSYNVARWYVLESLSASGKRIVVPPGTYYFGGSAMHDVSFTDLHIMGAVSFAGLDNWNIAIIDRVECFSDRLPITWTSLPMDRLYDIAYFANIAAGTRKNLVDAEKNAIIQENLTAENLHARDLVSSEGNIYTDGNVTARHDVKAGHDVIASGEVRSNNDVKASGDIWAGETDGSVIAGANGDFKFAGHYRKKVAIAMDSDSDLVPVGSYAVGIEHAGISGNPPVRAMNSEVFVSGLDDSIYTLSSNSGGWGRWRISGFINSWEIDANAGYHRWDIMYLIRRVE